MEVIEMNFFEYIYDGINYEFRMSNKAKVRIEEEQSKMLLQFSQDEELSKSLALLNELENANLSEAEKYELTMKTAPVLQAIQKLDAVVDPISLGYILLHSLSKYSSLKKEQYEAMVEDMEENLGFTKTQEVFKDIHDKVFSLIGATSNPKPQAKAKKKLN